ncbi:hypothetical protein [Granulicella sp. 5B5]|uniref:hypothetical protein n=1 Tax=Granulicella sp. 5B5 TaxID=1617967 RepID=UPI001C716251|nr:hypothetical protein [Granulicella sp. 5B5]
MRVNVYAEEMTERVEIISKEIDGNQFTGLRFYLELPCTVNGENVSGPFMHRPGGDDSAAVTFWGKRDLRTVLRLALQMLDKHYRAKLPQPVFLDAGGGDIYAGRSREAVIAFMRENVEDFDESLVKEVPGTLKMLGSDENGEPAGAMVSLEDEYGESEDPELICTTNT